VHYVLCLIVVPLPPGTNSFAVDRLPKRVCCKVIEIGAEVSTIGSNSSRLWIVVVRDPGRSEVCTVTETVTRAPRRAKVLY
jgi:hypothetical protein